MVPFPRATHVVALVLAGALLAHGVSDSALVDNVAYLGAMIGAGIGAWMGAERPGLRDRTVPRLIAAGICLTALGDVLWEILAALGADTDVSVADAPWFASYVAIGAALWMVLRRHRDRDRAYADFVLDAATVVAVSVVVFWMFSVATIVADDSVGPFVRAMWSAYPVADAVLIALVVRVMVTPAARGDLGPAFAVGLFLWLAADVLYLQQPADPAVVLAMDSAWLVAPALLATATWRREAPLPERTVAGGRRGGVGPLLLAVGPLFVPPALEVVNDALGRPDQPVALFLCSSVLIGLAFVRTARLLRSEERALRELERARDQALELSRAKSVFVANMSHELRTPLTTVLATAEMLEDTPLEPTQRQLLDRMDRAGNRLRLLVEEVLDFSRVEAGQADLDQAGFDLHELVAELVETYADREPAPGTDFEWFLDGATPRSAVGDPARIFQVVANLLDNALKFTEQGRVRLAVSPSPTSPAVVDFVVSDTGIGIPAEHQQSVFESFNQVDGSVTRRFGGSGLGLAICQQLTQMMGGTITLESEEGRGSTFTVSLPLTAAAPAPAPAPRSRPADQASMA